MTVSDLLEAIREPYVRTLAEAVKAQPGHVEPAFRQADGSLSVEGLLQVPCRADFIPKEGVDAGRPVSVDSSSRLQFDPISFNLGDTSVTISPFEWGWAQLEVGDLGNEAGSTVLRAWFLRWFDEVDGNDQTPEGLYGVAHFVSDPEPTELGFRVKADLGSSPARALEDLLVSLSDAGAGEVRVG